FPPETNQRLSHRHLDLLIDGLRITARQPAQLGGPALTLTDLGQLPQPDPHPGAIPRHTRYQRPDPDAHGTLAPPSATSQAPDLTGQTPWDPEAGQPGRDGRRVAR